VSEARLLVVDDEDSIRELLSASLRFAGFEVMTAADGDEAVRRAEELRPDLLVLDVMMPGRDGFAVAQALRSRGVEIPVVFLTARDAVEDRVRGLTLGGDDYLTKPFSLEELVARVRAVLRRTTGGRRDGLLALADLELDEDAHLVRKAGAEVELSPTEFNLLRYFLQNAGRVLSKQQILEHVWSYDFGGDGNVVESYVSYLRKKLDTGEPRLLHTVRGVGYVLRVPRDAG
jgi:two-component system OmpR family response regulator